MRVFLRPGGAEFAPFRVVEQRSDDIVPRDIIDGGRVQARLLRAVELVAATRRHQHSLVGASPRGTLALIVAARALALIRGRTYVVPEDVKDLAHPALDHRVTVKPELWLQNATGAGVVDSVLEQVPVPAAAQPDQPARATA